LSSVLYREVYVERNLSKFCVVNYCPNKAFALVRFKITRDTPIPVPKFGQTWPNANEEIEALMNCPTCGTEAKTGAIFCTVCGATLSAPVVASTPGQSSLTPYPSAPSMESSTTHDAAPYAPWIRRVLAQIIDVFFVIVPSFVVAIYVVAIKGKVHIATQVNSGVKMTCHFSAHALSCTGGTLIVANFRELLIGVVLINIVWAIYVVMAIAGPRGATFGMRALKIRIVTASDRAPVSVGRSVLRYVVYFAIGLLEYVAHILFLVSFLDWLWPLWDSRNQTLHDKAAGTVALDVRAVQR
jgi:uncharacterized RDD family membrane protein YckC